MGHRLGGDDAQHHFLKSEKDSVKKGSNRVTGFEEGKRKLATALVERVANGKEHWTCRQILQESMPEFAKENIIALAQRRLKQEKPFSWNPTADFDVNDVEVRTSFEKLVASLVRSMRLSHAELEHCLREAVYLRFDVLLKPQSTIEALLFRPAERVDKKIAVYKLDLLGGDLPFILRVKEKINASPENHLSKLVFALMAKEISDALYSCRNKTAAVKDFELLEDLFRLKEELTPKGVDAGLLPDFLHSRGLRELLGQVEKKIQQGKAFWQKQDFQDLFEFAKTTGRPAFAITDLIEEEERLLPRIVFQEEEKGPVYQSQREHQPPGPYPSIQSLIDSKDYKVLVHKIFERDERAFRSFIDKVDQVDKWRDAKQLIDWELNKRRLDPYCKEAVKLGDIVFAKYFNNSGYL